MPKGMTGYGRETVGYKPEKLPHKKVPKRPRHHQGLKQGTSLKHVRKPTEPIAHERIARGQALVKALEGVRNKRHSHDGSK